jgi:hypothetical protein
MHLPINIKSPNNIIKWHMGFNSAFKGLIKPAEHHHKAFALLWSIDTDIKVSASLSISRDTALKVAELFLKL